jgi:hypothetical protein
VKASFHIEGEKRKAEEKFVDMENHSAIHKIHRFASRKNFLPSSFIVKVFQLEGEVGRMGK